MTNTQVVEVRMEGVSPILLQPHFRDLLRRDPNGTPREQAELKTRRNPEGFLCVSSIAFLRGVKNVGKSFVSKKVLDEGIWTLSDEIVLRNPKTGEPLEDFEVWSTPFCLPSISTHSTMSHRPRLDKWAFDLVLMYDNSLIDDGEFQVIIDQVGIRSGLGFFSPAFGRFRVVRWKRKPLFS